MSVNMKKFSKEQRSVKARRRQARLAHTISTQQLMIIILSGEGIFSALKVIHAPSAAKSISN
jgi:hypothetical protein